MSQSPTSVARRVRDEIAAFVVPGPQPDAMGEPLPAEWFAGRLAKMQAALVEPYKVEVQGDGRRAESSPRRVMIVAEDEEAMIAYDPDPEGDFAVIFRSSARFGLSPIRGDSVDCWLSL